MKKWVIVLLFAISLELSGVGRVRAAEESPTSSSQTFTLWMLPPQTSSQMLSCVMRTPHGQVIVIDGGTAGDTAYLRGFLGALGNRVEAWFITHGHDDHFGPLTEILKKPEGIRIGAIYGSNLDSDWVRQHAPQDQWAPHDAYLAALKSGGVPFVEVQLGQEMTVDGVKIEVLSIKNPEITALNFNDSSVVLRVSDRRKSVLFLGDLGAESGRKLMKSPLASRLRADIVQMAHHGQQGVERDVYAAIGARVALWPTPQWLWDNDKGGGVGSGPWQTLEVRRWMEELGVRQNLVAKDGLQRID
ncbi:MAG TPA: MBL fold metallo-hydrolase [Candidatus Sumerlaeota bacterium]|nr:MBL fold metallo-hydrolase [Candidatus Sumerlaeota bacterium]